MMQLRDFFKITGVFLMIAGGYAQAQTIWTEPDLPTADNAITVYFDATDTGLEGYTGDVYTHTGVTTEESDWQYVIGDWGDNSVQPQLEQIDTDFYKLDITPDVYSFYDVPQSVAITGLNFVFRSEDAGQQSADLFVDIYESGLNVTFTEPANNPLVVEGAQIDVVIDANEADSVLFELDGNIVERVAGSSLEYTFNATGDADKIWMVAIAKDADNMVYDSAYYQIRPEVNTAPVPAGINKGVNYIDDNTVTLVFQAPYKEFVYVIGDFNNWEINNEYYMNLDPDGEHFWLTIEGLIPQQQYIYQYFIDGELKIADPYTEQISNPYNDHYITEDVYPGLIAYPDEKTTGNAAVLQTAQEEYDWQVENFTMPPKEDMVGYECLVRDFTEEGTYAAVTAKLDYLEQMGVNVLELMPVNEFEGNISWGYNPSFYFAPDKAYGPRSELKRLIDEAHQRGMAVLIDLVLNHSYGQSPLVQMYFDNGAPAENNPWYNRQHNFENTDAQWGYDFNHESPYTEALVDSINSYWMSEYNVDGFRFDFTKGFSNDIKDANSDPWGSNYDAERVENLKRISDAIWAFNPDAVVSMEHLAENSEETELANYGIVLWGNMNHNYNEGMMGYTESGKSDLRWGSYQERGWDEPNLLTYMESHDEERLMYKALTYGNQDNPEHDVQQLDVALERAGLSAAFLFAIPGPKMVWQFGELGYDYSIDYDCRTCPKPVRWDYLDDYRRAFLYDVYGALIHLKTNYEVFSTTDFSLDVRDGLKHVNLNGEEMNAVVIGNFNVDAGEISPEFQETGMWYEYITGDSLEVTDVSQTVTLQPGEYRVYTSERITPSGLSVSVPENDLLIDESAIYPNPFSEMLTISFEMKRSAEVQVAVRDIYGRKVAGILDGKLEEGFREIVWEPQDNLSKGIYIVEIINGRQKFTKKVVLK